VGNFPSNRRAAGEEPGPGVPDEVLLRHDRAVPRYTSYPTAPHFSEEVSAETYRAWLSALPAETPLSLYFHVPFCRSLCWFCGCSTRVVNRDAPVAAYVRDLSREMALVASALDDGVRLRRPVRHVHFGGGTPTIMAPGDIVDLMSRVREAFVVAADAEIAVEIDPRTLTPPMVDALRAIGLNRASLGIQDFSPEVQSAIHRIQPFAVVARAVEALRHIGVSGIGFDLVYGLPGQSTDGFVKTVRQAMALGPDRISLFGYAHVPWMRPHQKLIDESALPDAALRMALQRTAAEVLSDAGYVAVGLDHFARPGDPMARAMDEGRLHRNFQGYTTDDSGALLGFGASAIGRLPQGYVQNVTDVREYRAAVDAGRPAVVRGHALDTDDRMRATIIERLMCELEVDVGHIAREFGRTQDVLTGAMEALEPLVADGLVSVTADGRVSMVSDARPVVRNACAAFDTYLASGRGRHSRTV
jgi:oxygen-independent coproporphyrinogen-3 oxidase